MKPRKLMSGETGFVLLLGAVSLFFWVQALQIFMKDPTPSSQGAFPLFTTTLLLLMEIFMLLEMRRCEKAGRPEDSLVQRTKAVLDFLFPGRLPLIILYVLLYAIFMPKVGFIIGTALFLCGSMITLNAEKKLQSVIVSAGLVVVLVVLFQKIFLVVLP